MSPTMLFLTATLLAGAGSFISDPAPSRKGDAEPTMRLLFWKPRPKVDRRTRSSAIAWGLTKSITWGLLRIGWAFLATVAHIIPLGTAMRTSLSEQKAARRTEGFFGIPFLAATPEYFCFFNLSSLAESVI